MNPQIRIAASYSDSAGIVGGEAGRTPIAGGSVTLTAGGPTDSRTTGTTTPCGSPTTATTASAARSGPPTRERGLAVSRRRPEALNNLPRVQVDVRERGPAARVDASRGSSAVRRRRARCGTTGILAPTQVTGITSRPLWPEAQGARSGGVRMILATTQLPRELDRLKRASLMVPGAIESGRGAQRRDHLSVPEPAPANQNVVRSTGLRLARRSPGRNRNALDQATR
jgi:hypothetical protein